MELNMDNSIYKIKIMTLCFIQDEDKVLLGRKARKIGAGLWNGIGGNVEDGDKTIEDTAKREVKEEIGVEVGDITCLGEVDFKFPSLKKINKVVMFVTDDYKGELSPNLEEISELKWFNKNELPLEEMLAADKEFIPLLLKGKKIKGEVRFTDEFKLLFCNIEEISRELSQDR